MKMFSFFREPRVRCGNVCVLVFMFYFVFSSANDAKITINRRWLNVCVNRCDRKILISSEREVQHLWR